MICHTWWMAGFGLSGAFVALLALRMPQQDAVQITVDRIVRFERRY
jgi:hypothetical protein